jgi:hypothetical protein
MFPAASRARTVIALFPEAKTMPVTLQLVVPVAEPEAPVAAFVHVTAVTPMLSDAVPPRESGDDEVVYVGDDVGVVIVHVGATESYVTVRTSVPTFPAASLARTVIAFAPAASATLATLQLVVPVAVPETPVATFVHVTVATPMLSEAVPPSATVPDVVVYVGDEVGVVIVHVGAVPSYVTVIVSVPAFPAPSRARTVMTLFPAASAIPSTLQFVVPFAVPEAPVAVFVHVTAARPIASDAVPPRFKGDEAVA